MNKSVDCPLISFDYGEKSSRSKCIEDECVCSGMNVEKNATFSD